MHLVILMIVLAASATSLKAAEPVTVANFVRAVSDTIIRANMGMLGVSVGSLVHLRDPVTPENQPVIRMNQDTLTEESVGTRFALLTVRTLYVVRPYQPREEIIDGSWTFPDPVPLQ